MRTPSTFALCADDYAMAPGVSRGIREAIEAGRLSATSALTTSASWPREALALGRLGEKADIGLHLNLTLGRPLGRMPGLAPDGALPSIGTMIAAVRRGDLPRDEVRGEIERQLDAFADAFGRPPDHVDGHQHVQVLAPVRDILLEVLAHRGWAPWLRNSGDSPWRVLRRRETVVKAIGVSVLAGSFERAAQGRGFSTNEGFAGFSVFDEASSYAGSFARYLAAPGPAHLVMTHPGYVDEELRGIDPVVMTRERELAFLLSTDFVDLLADRCLTLRQMSQILAKQAIFKLG